MIISGTTPATLQMRIASLLQAPLPGVAAQWRMAPRGRTLHELTPPAGSPPRPAAVLLLLYPQATELSVIFTLRHAALNHHAGEISFPGGALEARDANLQQAALREGNEELGVPLDKVQILGALTPLYIPPSHNLVHPFVGWLIPPVTFQPQTAEVAQILTIPLYRLRQPQTITQQQWTHKGTLIEAPCYTIDEHCIWGATAMICSEFLAVITPLPEITLEERSL